MSCDNTAFECIYTQQLTFYSLSSFPSLKSSSHLKSILNEDSKEITTTTLASWLSLPSHKYTHALLRVGATTAQVLENSIPIIQNWSHEGMAGQFVPAGLNLEETIFMLMVACFQSDHHIFDKSLLPVFCVVFFFFLKANLEFWSQYCHHLNCRASFEWECLRVSIVSKGKQKSKICSQI